MKDPKVELIVKYVPTEKLLKLLLEQVLERQLTETQMEELSKDRALLLELLGKVLASKASQKLTLDPPIYPFESPSIHWGLDVTCKDQLNFNDLLTLPLVPTSELKT